MTQKIRSAEGLLRHIVPDGQKILPVEGEDNVLITSALPYCNNVPHLGNMIGSTLSADVFARYCRNRNRNTLYICGTDEYGTATETTAMMEKITPRELCDKYRKLHVETYDWFEIGFDYFGRTSTPQHTEICQEIYTNLSKNGMLKKITADQTYCEGCQRFLADRLIEGICPHCGSEEARGDECDVCGKPVNAVDLKSPRCKANKSHKIILKPTSHMHLKLDTLQGRIEEWIKSSWKTGGWSQNPTINSEGIIVSSFMKKGLQSRAVTRDLSWGVPVPNLEGADNQEMIGKVMYVWYDAPIGYPSITANYTPEWKQWWLNPKNVRLYQFMGKDNAYFHTIMFPGCQLGEGRDWTMLHHLSSAEYLQYEGGKFSKSHNRGVFGPAAKDTGIPASVWRFYLLSSRPESSDTMFSWAECVESNNNILLKNFGNFVNRVLTFIAKNYDGVVPGGGDEGGPLSPNDEKDSEFIAEVNNLLGQYIDAFDTVKLRLALQLIMRVSAAGNGYLQSAGLNSQLKASEPKRCAQILCRAVNLIYVLSVLVEPYMPSTSSAMLSQLNAPARTVPETLSIDILPGHVLGKPAHLFKPIDEKMADVWREQFAGSKVENALDTSKTHVAPPLSKRKAAAAAKEARKTAVTTETPATDGVPKSPEVLELEEKIAKQGNTVRTLKAQTPKSQELEEQIAAAVEELKRLKADLGKANSA